VRLLAWYNNSIAIVSSVTGSGFGKETIRTEDDVILQQLSHFMKLSGDPATRQEKGIIIAAFPSNTTNGTCGRLAPFDGMVAAGIHDVQPNNEEGVITLWE